MKTTKLLSFSSRISDAVFTALGEYAGYFGDNGGQPDGSGPYQRPVRFFEKAEIDAAKAAGAQVVEGYEVDYTTGKDSDPFYGAEYCGYQTDNVAYTTSRVTALSIQRYHDLAAAS